MGDLNPNIRDNLECTVCLEFAASPIHSCPGGHIVCGICIDKVKKCGLCEELLSPNGLAERLARRYEVDVPCLNMESGCRMSIKSYDLKAHLLKCEYRPISCFEKQTVDCRGQLIQLPEFYQHLKDDHKSIESATGKDESTFNSTSYAMNILDQVEDNWPVKIKKYDDKVFLIHCARGAANVYRWLTVIGGQEDAERYKYELQVKSPPETPKSKKVDLRWTLPMLPLRENFDLTEVCKSAGLYASIHKTALLSLCKERELNGTSFKYSWVTEIKIIKL